MCKHPLMLVVEKCQIQCQDYSRKARVLCSRSHLARTLGHLEFLESTNISWGFEASPRKMTTNILQYRCPMGGVHVFFLWNVHAQFSSRRQVGDLG